MKRIFVLLLTVLIFTACGREDAESPEIRDSLEYNESSIFSEELKEHLATLTPDDTLKVNVHIKGESYDDLSIRQMIAKNYGIPVSVCNAIENRDFDTTDPYAKKWYEENSADGDPTFEDNIDEARAAYMREYDAIKKETREVYYRNIVAEIPFRNDPDYDENGRTVYCYTATAEEISELSHHERVYWISPWTETPVEAPEHVDGASAFTKWYGDIKVNIIFDKDAYKYGDTVNVQIAVYNGSDKPVTFVPICETGRGNTGGDDYVSGFYYISAGFYADGEYRRDISCCYGYDASTDDVKPTLELLPGETMGKTYAFTPHRSYAFLGEPVSEEAEWKIKAKFEIIGETENAEHEYEVPVPTH